MGEVEVRAGEDDGVAEHRLTSHSIHLTSSCNSNSNVILCTSSSQKDDRVANIVLSPLDTA